MKKLFLQATFFLTTFILTTNLFASYNPEQGRWINRDPIGEEGGANLYAMVANDAVNKWDRLGLEVTQDAVITFKKLMINIKKWEKEAYPDDECTPCVDRLQKFRDYIHKNAIFTSSGSWTSGGDTGKNSTDKLGWHYIHTKQEGWIDMGHFSNAAYHSNRWWTGPQLWGFAEFSTKIGGGLVEIAQFSSAFIPGFPTASKTSAYTREDFKSNRLGAEFGKYVSDQGCKCTSLSDALKKFLNQYGPSNTPEKLLLKDPTIPESQAKLDSHMYFWNAWTATKNISVNVWSGTWSLFTGSTPTK